MPAAMTRTERIIQWICRAVIGIVLALPVCLGVTHGLLNLGKNPVLESALAGAFLIHMRARPKPAEWLSVLALGSAFTVTYAWLHHGYGNYLGAAPCAYATFLGLGSLIVLVVQTFVGARALRRLHRDTFLVAAAFPYFSFILAFCLNLTTALQPRIYDLSLYAFDEALQFKPSLLIGSLMASSSALTVAGVFAYQSMPLAICFLAAIERESPGRFRARILPLFVAVGLAGAFLYNLFPAVGPIYVFGKSFPGNLPSLSSLVIQPVLHVAAPRNAMPSVHFACALLIWWNAAGLARGWRWLAAGFVAMTFLATLGFGEHYFVDLVVALPFAVAMQSFALRTRSWAYFERRVAFWGGAGLTVCWIVALRAGLFLSAPALAWFAVLATCALALWWKRGLDRGHGYIEQKVLAVRPVVLAQEP
jgi:hypothetical protein